MKHVLTFLLSLILVIGLGALTVAILAYGMLSLVWVLVIR